MEREMKLPVTEALIQWLHGLDITPSEIIDRGGPPKDALYRLLRGDTHVLSDANTERLARGLNKTVHQLAEIALGNCGSATASVADGARAYGRGRRVNPVDVYPVRVYGLSQAKELKGDVWGNVVPETEEGLETMYTADPHVVAGFRVAGQSMEQRGIHDGDIVSCRTVESPADVPPDAVVVAKVDDEVYVKRYRRVGDTVLLLSAGADGRDLEVHASDIQWLLRAVEVVHKL